MCSVLLFSLSLCIFFLLWFFTLFFPLVSGLISRGSSVLFVLFFSFLAFFLSVFCRVSSLCLAFFFSLFAGSPLLRFYRTSGSLGGNGCPPPKWSITNAFEWRKRLPSLPTDEAPLPLMAEPLQSRETVNSRCKTTLFCWLRIWFLWFF
jgi:hypothetical protein